MKLYDFLFGRKYPVKYYRHILFWATWFVYIISNEFYTKIVNPPGTAVLFGVGDPFVKEVIELLSEIGLVYGIVYFLVPRFYMNNKKASFFIYTFFGIVTVFYIYYLIQDKTSYKLLYNVWFSIGNFIGVGPVFITVLFISVKMMKHYYVKLEEKETLEREKANAEIQFLKAQVHPHFLFNTLNNIYSFTLSKSPLAGTLVLKLYDTLTYMINDCNADFVPVEKELKMIEDYISLEKVRYGNRLQMLVEIKGECQNKLIAPLLLIPFVENCFKHGSGKVLKNPWIRLSIVIGETMLYMDLRNSKPSKPGSRKGKQGIGLENAQKRLELLFPEKYELFIQSTDDEFSVVLQIPILPIPVEAAGKAVASVSQNFMYA
ncbi:hypothetical protein FW778_12465 [Ginsengibacter hankyongi]|uniref:Signal transduction histidine kinase internal region domain-containing protein n=1 Tax=Ginsengibacter hankyongi TaxID=2607284 RepID=A0A5J5IH44_9BACT|nr:histidine kinase [Ginsengibacter hankyongi]KAA9038380.1 hypothetical protein FW778_12465 [Ginsengibacter hankyongi]